MPRPAVPEQLTHAPFTLATAAKHGVTRKALMSRPWRRVLQGGVWAHVDLPDTQETRLAAARLVIPQYGVLCGLTAAWAHGLDVRRADDLDVHVGFPKGKRIRSRPGLVVCQETLVESDWAEIDGLRITTPLRTTFDCLRWLRGAERLVVADAMTHAALVSVDELRRYFGAKHRLRNLRRGELLLDDIEPLSESPMETRLRVALLLDGLRPVAQHDIHDASGRFVGRADLAFPEQRLAVEYDGAWHWKQRRHDDRRRAAMRAADWEVLVYDADDVYGDPDRVTREVQLALRSRGIRPSLAG